MRVIVLDTLDFVMRRLQPGVGDDYDMHTSSLFQGVDLIAFFIEQVSCAFNRYLGQNLAGVIFQCFVFK
jgi:hypothetical protein